MSVLHARIVAHGGQGRAATAAGGMIPFGTSATPLVLPSTMLVSYAANTGIYQDVYPSPPATGDVNAVPLTELALRPGRGVRSQPVSGPPGYDTSRARYAPGGPGATGDVNAAPTAMISSGSFGPVIPAGRP